ncbi:stage II sporulation protein M [Longispora albida]|uniref:stage II sporulation protein M n=1 Tax=Longispora albida TaxID=203523 RepID=UPI00037D5848|nr:stage II sporulation protein M [Longispora albida]
MDLDAYVAEHRGEWSRLERLATRRRLSAAEVDELVALYQRTTTHLSVIRSRTPDPALISRLSRIVLEARGALTPTRKFSWPEAGRFFTVTFPVAAYKARWWWLAVSLVFTGLALAMMYYVAAHPEVQQAFMSESGADKLVNHDFESYYSEHAAQDFAFRVWTNNAWIAAVSLAAGVLIVPVVYVLFQNLVGIGTVGGIMIGHGRADLFFGLIAPHGLLELTAVFLAAGVGLRIGWAWIAPGTGRTRAGALAEAARSGVTVALGLVLVLFVSALVEAFVTPSPFPTAVRILIGFVVWAAFLAYVLVLGARGAAAGETGDVLAESRSAEDVLV